MTTHTISRARLTSAHEPGVLRATISDQVIVQGNTASRAATYRHENSQQDFSSADRFAMQAPPFFPNDYYTSPQIAPWASSLYPYPHYGQFEPLACVNPSILILYKSLSTPTVLSPPFSTLHHSITSSNIEAQHVTRASSKIFRCPYELDGLCPSRPTFHRKNCLQRHVIIFHERHKAPYRCIYCGRPEVRKDHAASHAEKCLSSLVKQGISKAIRAPCVRRRRGSTAA